MLTDSLDLADATPDEVVYEVDSCASYVPASDTAALSAAISCANANADTNIINLTNSTYTFTLGEITNSDSALPRITTPIIINGNGAIIERASTAASNFRLFYVSGGASLTLKNVTIRGGSSDNGGGIYNSASLTLVNSTVSGNTASNNGGGIANS